MRGDKLTTPPCWEKNRLNRSVQVSPGLGCLPWSPNLLGPRIWYLCSVSYRWLLFCFKFVVAKEELLQQRNSVLVVTVKWQKVLRVWMLSACVNSRHHHKINGACSCFSHSAHHDVDTSVLRPQRTAMQMLLKVFWIPLQQYCTL